MTSPRTTPAPRSSLLTFLLLVCATLTSIRADDPTDGTLRLRENQLHILQAQTLPGLLVPLYVYPENVAHNPHWNRLIELKRRYPQVPVCAIVNPNSGPGDQVDTNYQLGIRRLNSAGIIMIGYVSTDYAKIPAAKVQAEIDRWHTLYPIVHGIFLDETTSDAEKGHVEHYVGVTRHAHDSGFWPVVANPGTMIDPGYFDAKAADVFVIHEIGDMPTDDVLSRLEETPCTQLGILVYGQPKLDPDQLRRLAGTARWLYITDDKLQPNPWDTLTGHAEAIFEALGQ